jgi:hypothetical protein
MQRRQEKIAKQRAAKSDFPKNEKNKSEVELKTLK